jgi:hypothetical protein
MTGLTLISITEKAPGLGVDLFVGVKDAVVSSVCDLGRQSLTNYSSAADHQRFPRCA